MADELPDVDSEGVYLGMSLEDFGVRVSASAPGTTKNATRSDEENDEKGARTVPRDQLKQSIQHLREELAAGEPLSGEDRSELEDVLGEVSGILDSEAGEHETRKDFFSELGTLVERFEVTHPKLAIVLGRIADSLSQLGI